MLPMFFLQGSKFAHQSFNQSFTKAQFIVTMKKKHQALMTKTARSVIKDQILMFLFYMTYDFLGF